MGHGGHHNRVVSDAAINRRAWWCATAGVSVVVAALVLWATRTDPLLSPDSITYLSVADHIRSGRGLTDFTTKPMTVFGPLYPLLLAPGGRSLLWARLVGAAALATGAFVMALVLRRRVHPWMAVAAALAFGAGQGMVDVASVVWSEAPFAVVALAMVTVLSRTAITTRNAAIGGALAGLGFLTRYAGVTLLVTGAVMVALSTRHADRTTTAPRLGAFAAGAGAVGAPWIIRNLIETGQPLGPRFEGGVGEPLTRTIRLALIGTGRIVVDVDWSEATQAWLGGMILVGVALAAYVALRHSQAAVLDVGMATLAATSVVVPIVARIITANDIEQRVMSPMLIPLVFFAAVTADRLCTGRTAIALGVAALGWWGYQGVTFATSFPDLAPAGSGYKAQFAPELYDAIDGLAVTATILTNSPQRVWWFTDREPTVMGFTQPRPGNSHYPLDAAATVAVACTGNAYLAWFDGLQNAGEGPAERRPDLTELVTLDVETTVAGGTLYRLTPADPDRC